MSEAFAVETSLITSPSTRAQQDISLLYTPSTPDAIFRDEFSVLNPSAIKLGVFSDRPPFFPGLDGLGILKTAVVGFSGNFLIYTPSTPDNMFEDFFAVERIPIIFVVSNGSPPPVIPGQNVDMFSYI